MKNCPKHGKKFIKSRIVTDAHRLETDNDDDHTHTSEDYCMKCEKEVRDGK